MGMTGTGTLGAVEQSVDVLRGPRSKFMVSRVATPQGLNAIISYDSPRATIPWSRG
jgi:hypothetical protein